MIQSMEHSTPKKKAFLGSLFDGFFCFVHMRRMNICDVTSIFHSTLSVWHRAIVLRGSLEEKETHAIPMKFDIWIYLALVRHACLCTGACSCGFLILFWCISNVHSCAPDI